MAVTLAQAKLDAQDDIQRGVIDEFRKASFLLDRMQFDQAVSPGTAGATMTYGYTRLVTQRGAAFRAVNTEYTPQEVTKQRAIAELKFFGGTYEIDRVLAAQGGLVDEVALQMGQLIKATRSLFHDAAVNGDVAVDANSYDGLNKMLAGTASEYNAAPTATVLDLSAGQTDAALESAARLFLDRMDDYFATLDGKPDALMGNGRLIARIKAAGRRAGYITKSEDSFGRQIESYDGIPLVDLGEKPGSSLPIVPIVTRDPDGAGAGGNVTGLTDLYAVRFGLDAFHAISMAGVPVIRSWLPDFTTQGAVKRGEAEMIAAVVLKATKAAGVFRNIKVQ